jgi:hypothetical protein
MRGSPPRPGTPTPLRAVLVCGAAVAALTACSGGGSGTTAASGSSPAPATSSSAAPTSGAGAAAAGSDFCTRARAFATEASQAVAGANGPGAASQLQALVTQLQSTTPPPAISADWQSAVAALQQFVTAYQGVDLTDPAQAQQLQQKIAPLVQQLSASGTRIDQYLQDHCGLSVGGTGSAAPSS